MRGLVLVFATVESAYARAYHDELTGLPARRALNDALQRVEGMYAVAMVDVDYFKKFNDTHGHDVGDQVLRMVARRLACVEGGGRAFRYKVRESVESAMFTKCSRDRPKRKPKTVRARDTNPKRLSVTVSIGVSQARISASPDDVVRAADKALDRAKEGGRNRVAM